MTPSMRLSQQRPRYTSALAAQTDAAGDPIADAQTATGNIPTDSAQVPPAQSGNPYSTGPAAPATDQPQMQTNLGGTSQRELISQSINNENNSNAMGNNNNNEIAGQIANYQSLQDQFGSQAYNADQQLQQTPGYNSSEAGAIGNDYTQDETNQDQYNSTFLNGTQQAAILGNTDAAKAYYNPSQLTGETQQGNQAVTNATQGLQSGLNSAIDPSKLTASQGYNDQLNNANAQQTKGLTGVIGNESGALDASVDPTKLGVSADYMQNEQLSPAQQQAMVTEAGVTTGNQYRSAANDLSRNAQASGNSSPTAIAAAEDRLTQQSGAAEGEAEANAQIAASNAAAGRLQTATTTNLGANQAIAGMEQNNATTVGNQGIGAAETEAQTGINTGQAEENTRLGANQSLAGLETNAATVGGQAAISAAAANEKNTLATDTANQTTGENLAQTADQQQSARQLTLATNGQAQQTAENANKYAQSTQAQQLNSQGQQTIGNARIAGNTQNLNYLTGQQTQAQQGAETATGQKIQNYQAQTGAANAATGTAGNIANAKANQPSTFDQIAGAAVGAAGAIGLADGGVQPSGTEAIVGEHGPEYVGDPAGAAPAIASYLDSQQQPQPRSKYTGYLQNRLAGLQPPQAGQVPPAQPSTIPGQVKPHSAIGNMGSLAGTIGNSLMHRTQGMSGDDPGDTGASIQGAYHGDDQGDPTAAAIGGAQMFADGGVVNQPTLGAPGDDAAPYPGAQQQPQSNTAAPQPDAFNGMSPTAQGQGQPPPPAPGVMPAPASNIAPAVAAAQPPATPAATAPMPPKSPFMTPPRYAPASAQPGQQRPPGGAQPAKPQAFADGGVITRPTRVSLGNKGTDVVVPLNPGPSSKLTPSMMGIHPTLRTPYKSPAGTHGLHALNILRSR